MVREGHMTKAVIDRINKKTMRVSVDEYADNNQLTAAEKAALIALEMHLVNPSLILVLAVVVPSAA